MHAPFGLPLVVLQQMAARAHCANIGAPMRMRIVYSIEFPFSNHMNWERDYGKLGVRSKLGVGVEATPSKLTGAHAREVHACASRVCKVSGVVSAVILRERKRVKEVVASQ